MRTVCRLFISAVFAGSIVALITMPSAVHASESLTTSPTPPALPASPVIITAYQINGSSLEFVQLYNTTNELVNLYVAKLLYSQSGAEGAYEAASLSGLMKPRTHVLITRDSIMSDIAIEHFNGISPSSVAPVNHLAFAMPDMAVSSIPAVLKTNGSIQQRGKTTTGYSTVTFGNFDGTLYADELYKIPDTPLLKIIEISPRAKTCNPFDIDPTCGDYVKLKLLPGFSDSMLSDYRLRSGTGADSVTNTFSLLYASKHEDYVLLRLRDDGELLSLTNNGGHVWLEDNFGVKRYEETLTSYADAGSEDFINQSWAFDESTGIWKWAIPSPISNNTFPEVLGSMAETPSSIVCSAGKYLNPETNRCRSIEEAVSALATCEEGKERNPITNRCRSIVALASTSLTPCSEGEERNPATNRCRKVMSVSSSLTPCAEGYERNAETNRCRKSLLAASSLSTPASVASTANANNSSLKTALIITAGMGAFGYAVYEWRYELLRLMRRITSFTSDK